MTDNPKLLPCPFCGCADIGCEPINPRDPQSLFVAGCQECNARTAPGYGHRGAADNWNRRVEITKSQCLAGVRGGKLEPERRR